MMGDTSSEKVGLHSYRDLRTVDKPGEEGSAPPPKCLGRYEILAELGRGAMGMVYKARDPRIHRIVAIKIITISGGSKSEIEEHRIRFFREAQAAGRLSHPGIVTIYDVDEDPISHTPFIVMEYVPGKRLDTLIAGLPSQHLPRSKSLALAEQLAEALGYAHGKGIVHRDIKPANVIVTEDGYAKIADFGIAKITLTELTLPGQMLGTPAFMAPEQFLGEPVDRRSDLFSLGVVLYWMLTGIKPFEGENATNILFKLVYEEPIPVTQVCPALHPHFDTVLQRALAKDPIARYQSGEDFARDLRILLQADRPKAADIAQENTAREGQLVKQISLVTARVVAARIISAGKRWQKQFLEHCSLTLSKIRRSPYRRWALVAAAFLVLITGIVFFRAMDKQTALKGQNAPERPKPIVEGAEPISADMPSIGRSIRSVPKTARPHLVPHGDRAASPDIPLAVERRSVSKKVVGESADTEDQTLAKPQSQELTEEGSVSDSSTEAINSTMRVVGEHSFHSAILSILVDNKPVYVGTLRAARRFPLGRLRGTVSAILRVAPGPHTVAISDCFGTRPL